MSIKDRADRIWQPVTVRWFLVVFGIALAYAVVRYHLAGDVPWAQFPLFILNKATSLAAVMFVACSYLIGRVFTWHNKDPRKLVIIKFCGLMGLSLAGIHAFMALCVLRPEYFPKFFLANGQLNAIGGWGLLAGIVALWFLVMPGVATIPGVAREVGGQRWKRGQRMGYLALGMVVVHMVVFGWKGWMNPSGWHGGLPPISLWAALVAAFTIVVKLRSRR